MNIDKPDKRTRWFAALALPVSIALLIWPAPAHGRPGSRTNDRSDEMASCKASLNRILESLREYEKAYGTLPNHLSDLHPEFVADPRLFICPAVQRRGDFRSWRRGVRDDVFADPLPTSYAYEFNMEPYPLWVGQASTWREYKQRLMKILGPEVPIIRCLAHEPKLYLSIGGTIHTSGFYWEDNFADVMDVNCLYPPAIFSDLAPLPGRFTNNISPRDPLADPRLLDLSRFYVAPLQSPWLWNNPEGEDLSELRQGVVEFPQTQVTFDVRGLIQLTCPFMIAPFPARVDGIPVGQKCRLLHFLDGAVRGDRRKPGSWDKPGTEIGSYEIHYANRPPVTVPIRYGQDILSWDYRGKEPSAGGARVAWEGYNDDSRADGYPIRLYHQQWQNPHPEEEIASIDFVGGNAIAAPFLIAITLE